MRFLTDIQTRHDMREKIHDAVTQKCNFEFLPAEHITTKMLSGATLFPLGEHVTTKMQNGAPLLPLGEHVTTKMQGGPPLFPLGEHVTT